MPTNPARAASPERCTRGVPRRLGIAIALAASSRSLGFYTDGAHPAIGTLCARQTRFPSASAGRRREGASGGCAGAIKAEGFSTEHSPVCSPLPTSCA